MMLLLRQEKSYEMKDKLNTIEEAIADIKDGKIVIVVDDEDRENEGDFICAAEIVTPEIITFMATHGRGLICTPIDEDRAEELQLTMMVGNNTALHETAFTVSVDLIGQGCTTGISSYDRATGIKALIHPEAKAADFARPGHIFPLRAKKGGVLRRTGHTEAAIDLARLAGFAPAGVLVEILNEDGTMARLPQLLKIAERHDMKIITIKDLVEYRMRNERIIKKEIELDVPSKIGDFKVAVYSQLTTGDRHLAIYKGEIKPEQPALVRVHSQTETGDILGTLFGEYGTQLQSSLKMIEEEGVGVLLYMRHSEKGDSIITKLKELDNNPTNDPLKKTEQRDFGVGAQILREMNVRKINLLTNNPKRRVGLIGYDLEVVNNVPF